MKKYDLGLKLKVHITKEKDVYVAWSPALDLSTSGKTEAQAKKRFEESASIFLEELVEAGTVDKVLSSLGWKKEVRSWEPPKVKQQTVKVNLPAVV